MSKRSNGRPILQKLDGQKQKKSIVPANLYYNPKEAFQQAPYNQDVSGLDTNEYLAQLSSQQAILLLWKNFCNLLDTTIFVDRYIDNREITESLLALKRLMKLVIKNLSN